MLAWTEPTRGNERGLDQLGLRVAGESAYEQLIDFTTTVAWRPRYFSLFCWATREAYRRAGGRLEVERHPVNLSLYKKELRRLEYGVAAATLADDQGALRVAGSTRISEALESDTTIELKGDHLKASSGGLSIYGGPMRLLGLVSSASGVDLPPQGGIGEQLADAFQRSCGSEPFGPVSANAVTKADLRAAAATCSLTRLTSLAEKRAELGAELDLLRSIIVDWNGFGGGAGPTGRRILSLGLILELFRLLPEEPPDLERFREGTLLGGIRVGDEVRALDLASTYEEILPLWRMYQSHAYATLALEALLSFVLSVGIGETTETNAGVAYGAVLARVRSSMDTGLAEIAHARPWKDLRVSELATLLDQVTEKNRVAPLAEPELALRIRANRFSSDSELAEYCRDAALLFFLSAARMKRLFSEAPKSWVGREDEHRLPPRVLIDDWERASASGISVADHVVRVVEHYVIKQHETNALRKLAAQPTVDSARFYFDGDEIVVVAAHQAGTSNPRYENAVYFLSDLGYLEDGSVTPLGTELLDRLRGKV